MLYLLFICCVRIWTIRKLIEFSTVIYKNIEEKKHNVFGVEESFVQNTGQPVLKELIGEQTESLKTLEFGQCPLSVHFLEQSVWRGEEKLEVESTTTFMDLESLHEPDFD